MIAAKRLLWENQDFRRFFAGQFTGCQGRCHGVVRKAKPFGMMRRLRRLEPLDPVEEADTE